MCIYIYRYIYRERERDIIKCMYMYIYIYTHICRERYVYVCVCMCMYVYVYIHIHIHIHIYLSLSIYIYTHTYAYVHLSCAYWWLMNIAIGTLHSHEISCLAMSVVEATTARTFGFHNFNLRIFNLRVSNPIKLLVDTFFDTVSDFNVPGSRPKKTRWNFGNRPQFHWLDSNALPSRWRAPLMGPSLTLRTAIFHTKNCQTKNLWVRIYVTRALLQQL